MSTPQELIKALRAPFTTAAIKWKVQSRGMIVYYIDARLVVERLNHVVPGLWTEATDIWPAEPFMRCRLTIEGLGTHEDVGEPGSGPQGKAPKAVMSDALKRVGVRHGIGVSVYAIPKLWLGDDGGFFNAKGYLTAKGDSAARTHYEGWLEAVGKHAFGDPIDHGDAEGAQGDFEVDDAPHDEPAAERPLPPRDGPGTGRRRRQADPAPATPASENPNRLAKAHAVGAELGYEHADLRTIAQWLTRNDHGDQGSPATSMSGLSDDQLARLEASLEWMVQQPDEKSKLDGLVAKWVAKTAQASIAGTT